MAWFGNSLGTAQGIGEFTEEDRAKLEEISQNAYGKHQGRGSQQLANYAGQALFSAGLVIVFLWGFLRAGEIR